MYIKPDHRSYPQDASTPLTTAQEVISGMNLVDIMVGAQPTSFIKYNLAFSSEAVCQGSLADHLHTNVLTSLEGNLSPSVSFYLREQLGDRYDVLLAKMNEYATRAATLVVLLDENAQNNLPADRYEAATRVIAANANSTALAAADVVRAEFAALAADVQNVEKRREFNEAFSHLIYVISGFDLQLSVDSGN